jgi:hypothetical protein
MEDRLFETEKVTILDQDLTIARTRRAL